MKENNHSAADSGQRQDFSLPKAERICSVSDIAHLVSKGRYINLGVIRCCHCPRENATDDLNRIMVSVPKKLFRRAVKRNLLKRRIRESYRLQKHILDGVQGIDMMFVYNTKGIAEFKEIHDAVGSALKKIAGHGKQSGQQ